MSDMSDQLSLMKNEWQRQAPTLVGMNRRNNWALRCKGDFSCHLPISLSTLS